MLLTLGRSSSCHQMMMDKENRLYVEHKKRFPLLLVVLVLLQLPFLMVMLGCGITILHCVSMGQGKAFLFSPTMHSVRTGRPQPQQLPWHLNCEPQNQRREKRQQEQREQEQSATDTAQSLLNLLPRDEAYQWARQVRIEQGHAAAVPYYQVLLRNSDPNADWTTATRLAARADTPQQLIRLVNVPGQFINQEQRLQTLRELRAILQSVNYTHRGVANIFGIHRDAPRQHPLYNARAAVYLTPAAPGSVFRLPFGATPTAAHCLAALFLLGIAVPCRIFCKACPATLIDALSTLGWLATDTHPSIDSENEEEDKSVIYALVSLMPLEAPHNNQDLYWMTDWHPRVLNSISIADGHYDQSNGCADNGYHDRRNSFDDSTSDAGDAVMYIGPDSLALVQHWIASSAHRGRSDSFHPGKERQQLLSTTQLPSQQFILDLCAGSGIHGLTALLSEEENKMEPSISPAVARAHVVALDINPRALNFTNMNAILNQIRHDDGINNNNNNNNQLTLVQGDLLMSRGRLFLQKSNGCNSNEYEFLPNLLKRVVRQRSNRALSNNGREDGYDWILANPPFVPVPPVLVHRKHGLFSAGGPNGEAVLAAILRLAAQVLNTYGYLVVVSEFFLSASSSEPSSSNIFSADALIRRLHAYWNEGVAHDTINPRNLVGGSVNETIKLDPSFRGLLFTNERPLSAAEYVQRRVDTMDDAIVWLEHMQNQGIAGASPGLLYLQKIPTASSSSSSLFNSNMTDFRHVIVPTSKAFGSIWSPSNPDAVAFTQQVAQDYFGW